MRFIIILALIFMTACAQDDRSGRTYVSDAGITTAINGRYIKDSVVSAFDINVDTYRGKVTLTGHVPSQYAKKRAIRLAEATKGVTEVNRRKIDCHSIEVVMLRSCLLIFSLFYLSSCVVVAAGALGAGGYYVAKDKRDFPTITSDAAITSKINGKYTLDKTVSAVDINVDTYDGAVILKGYVPSDYARNRAIGLAKSIKGVKSVNADALEIGEAVTDATAK